MFHHVIRKDGIKVEKAKINSIVNLPPPTYMKEVGSSLGYANYYHHFIKDYCKMAKPLANLLVKHMSFHFSEECHEAKAFTNLKEALTSALILHPTI